MIHKIVFCSQESDIKRGGEAFEISVKELETVSRFLGNFNHKTTRMMREINFQVFKEMMRKKKTKIYSH